MRHSPDRLYIRRAARGQASSFFAELKRRNVYKVAIAYAVITWLLI